LVPVNGVPPEVAGDV